MKRISLKNQDLIRAIAFRASDEFLTFFLVGDIIDLIEDLQACHQRAPLDLEKLLNCNKDSFSYDITLINHFFRLKRGKLTPSCLKQAPAQKPA
jgi:hypothetical protein